MQARRCASTSISPFCSRVKIRRNTEERGSWVQVKGYRLTRLGRRVFSDSITRMKDPWGREVILRCPGTVNTDGVDVVSVGPDGQEGTADDVKAQEQ